MITTDNHAYRCQIKLKRYCTVVIVIKQWLMDIDEQKTQAKVDALLGLFIGIRQPHICSWNK